MRGLVFSHEHYNYMTSDTHSMSAGLMYNPDAMKCQTPPAFQRIRLLMEVNEWTG